MRSVGATEIYTPRSIENLVSERHPKTARDIRTLALVGDTNGPELPSSNYTDAAPQLHQTGHSSIAQRFRGMKVGRAGPLCHLPRQLGRHWRSCGMSRRAFTVTVYRIALSAMALPDINSVLLSSGCAIATAFPIFKAFLRSQRPGLTHRPAFFG